MWILGKTLVCGVIPGVGGVDLQMCSSVDYWRCRWIKLGGALEYPQRGPSDPHPGPDLSTACPQGYPQGWREDPQGVENGTRRCGDAHICPSTEARSPPRRANRAVRIQVLVREGGAGSSSSAVAMFVDK